MLFLEPSSFSFITRPTKRCLRVFRKHVGTMERFCRVNALELGSPCGFHIGLSHLLLLCQGLMPPDRAASRENPERGRGAWPGVPELCSCWANAPKASVGGRRADSTTRHQQPGRGMGVPRLA